MKALEIGEKLLKMMPELKTEDEIRWDEEEAGENFRLLCKLFKGNVIPTKKLDVKWWKQERK